MPKHHRPSPDIDLPPQPRRFFLVTALLVMIVGPVLCLLLMVSQASGVSDSHTLPSGEATALTLPADKEYTVLGQQGVTCRVTDPTDRPVTVTDAPWNVGGRSLPSQGFETGDAGTYAVECVTASGDAAYLIPADFKSKLLLIAIAALLAIALFVVGGILVIIAAILRSKAKKRYEAARAEAVQAALARERAEAREETRRQAAAQSVYSRYPAAEPGHSVPAYPGVAEAVPPTPSAPRYPGAEDTLPGRTQGGAVPATPAYPSAYPGAPTYPAAAPTTAPTAYPATRTTSPTAYPTAPTTSPTAYPAAPAAYPASAPAPAPTTYPSPSGYSGYSGYSGATGTGGSATAGYGATSAATPGYATPSVPVTPYRASGVTPTYPLTTPPGSATPPPNYPAGGRYAATPETTPPPEADQYPPNYPRPTQ
ncbi:MAG: hypothetical protein LBR33_04510 [Propionibacteriaceae bacterium]|jgi:hypothetical protein|nr:hypothetical protein [Propionibacteriaceae bacterium]